MISLSTLTTWTGARDGFCCELISLDPEELLRSATHEGNPGIKLMNAMASRIALAHGADVWDEWQLRYLAPEDGDGHHACTPDGDGFNTYDSPSCKGAFAVLLRLIELRANIETGD